MTTLQEARESLAAALGCAPHVPDVLYPPCVVLGPAEDYVTPGETFLLTDARVGLEVFVLVEITDGATMLAQLDQALPTVLAVLEAEGWGIEGTISRPDTFATADWEAYGVQITVRREMDLPALATPAVPTFVLTDTTTAEEEL